MGVQAIKNIGLPGHRIGKFQPDQGAFFHREFHFRKSWPAILLVLVLDIVFLIPVFSTLHEAATLWRAPDDLFDLMGALFISFWLLGWSMAPLLISSVLLLMLFGREVVQLGPGELKIFLGLPRFGVTVCYEPGRLANPRIEHPTKKSGRAWRGSHLVLDYADTTIAFGSEVDQRLLAAVQAAMGRVRNEPAGPGGAGPAPAVSETAAGEPALASTRSADAGEIYLAPVNAPEEVSLGSPSTLALIAANAVPLLGAAFGGWDLGAVMVLYWAESAIIGFFNLAKIIVIGRWQALFLGPFFLGHFGGFMAGHFLFLYTLFIERPGDGSAGPGDLDQVLLLFLSLWPALLVLFLSHAFSFFRNFLGRKEYLGRTMKQQMSEPYSRIIFMHLVLIFGGGLSLVLGGARPVLLIVIALKVVVDVYAHIKQRQSSEAAIAT